MAMPRESIRDMGGVERTSMSSSDLIMMRRTSQWRRLVVEDDIKQGAMHVDTAVVVQEAMLPELIHEETYP
jgi:hypothetical protein